MRHSTFQDHWPLRDFIDKQPFGFNSEDLTTFMKLGYLAQRIFSDCVRGQDGAGWSIAGDDNSMAIAFGGTGSVWDNWSMRIMDSLPWNATNGNSSTLTMIPSATS